MPKISTLFLSSRYQKVFIFNTLYVLICFVERWQSSQFSILFEVYLNYSLGSLPDSLFPRHVDQLQPDALRGLELVKAR